MFLRSDTEDCRVFLISLGRNQSVRGQISCSQHFCLIRIKVIVLLVLIVSLHIFARCRTTTIFTASQSSFQATTMFRAAILLAAAAMATCCYRPIAVFQRTHTSICICGRDGRIRCRLLDEML